MVHNGFTDQGPTIGTPCIARFNFLRSQDSLRLKLDFFVIFPGAYVGLMLVGLEPARMMHRLPVLSSGQTVNTCRSEQSVEEIRLTFGKSGAGGAMRGHRHQIIRESDGKKIQVKVFVKFSDNVIT